MAKSRHFSYCILNNFRVFGFLVPKGTKQFSASENVSLIVYFSQRSCKNQRKFSFSLFFSCIKKIIRGWGSFWQVQLSEGPCATFVGGSDVSGGTWHCCAASQPVSPCSCPGRLPSAGISESAFRLFAEGANHHDKLQECDLFPSLLSLCYDVL